MWIISIVYNGSGIQSMQDQNVSLEVELLMPNLAKESITPERDAGKPGMLRNGTEQNGTGSN